MSTVGGGVNIVTDGLVLYLDAANTKSYSRSGTIWTDVSRGGNNGTLTNGPTFNSGNGGSIVFDGTNDYVTGSTSNISVYTLCIFVKILALKAGGGIFGGNLNPNIYLQMGGASVWQFESAFTAYTPVVGQWFYVVGVQTSTNQILYLNGVQVAIAAGTTSLGTSYIIGRRETGLVYTNYQVAQTSIYNRALTSQEVLQNYNATKSRFGL